MYNLVTPCTRPENLKRIYKSIISQSYQNLDNVTWWIVFDIKHVDTTVFESDFIHPLLKIVPIYMPVPGSVVGHGQRNVVLKNLRQSEWFYSIDDDNILHKDFLKNVNEVISEHPDVKAIVVDQIHPNGKPRLVASPENTKRFHIDTAQYIVRKDLVGDDLFQIGDYNADGIFIETLHDKCPEMFKFINKPLSYYNYLRN